MSRLRRSAIIVYAALFVSALFFLGMVTGVMLVRYEVQPGPWLDQAVTALRAWDEYLFDKVVARAGSKQRQLVKLGLWQRERTRDTGVLRNNPTLSFAGYTLYTSAHDQGARLLDPDGRVVHEWQKSFAEIWPDGRHLAPTPRVDPEFLMWRHAYLYPNGDILAVFEGLGVTPWGSGLAKLDRNSRVLWTFDDRVHHEVDVAPDGRIAALTHALRDKPLGNLSFLQTPLVEDFVVILSPDGKRLGTWSLYEALAASPWEVLLHLANPKEDRDYLHANTVKFVPAGFASANPPVEEGDLMITLRETDTVCVLRPSSGEIVWARRVPCEAPHHATPLPNGNIIIFDNGGRKSADGFSRVIEFEPGTGRTVWCYQGSPGQVFYSRVRSGQQVLPNGNVLITESDAGRMIEVTRSGEIVWEWRTPHRGEAIGLPKAIPVICAGTRYSAEQLPFVAETK
ncbi:MAG: arylsulfotransferase family protein [Candidatus Sumerlaeaceae bacterium]|nr:arylsulfotransferase family protein [Candidatus Sumerlaeaceae bacterium]